MTEAEWGEMNPAPSLPTVTVRVCMVSLDPADRDRFDRVGCEDRPDLVGSEDCPD
jgi:hypothetical protein